MLDPVSRPRLRLLPMLRALEAHGIDWILTGSAVLALHGGALVPNDLDVTPSLEPGNLERLAQLLRDHRAIPYHYREGLSMEECRAWRPEPATIGNLDHLFVTDLGMLDLVPSLCGTYTALAPDAVEVDVGGVTVQVCALREVLTRLDGRTRRKDRERADVYESLRRWPEPGIESASVARLLTALP